MPTVSLNDFVAFISATPTTRIAVTRQIKSRDNQPYDIRKDYYKRLREAIISLEKGSLSVEQFENLPNLQRDLKKKTGFVAPVINYVEWRDTSKPSNSTRVAGDWRYANLIVKLNPEISLRIDGVLHHTKLNFKTEPVPQSRSDLILVLIQEGLCKDSERAAILDIREKRMRTLEHSNPDLSLLLRVEASAFCVAWDMI